MKKRMVLCLLGLYCLTGSAQNKTMFVRHDTILLNANECDWLLRADMQQAKMTDKSVPTIILDAIAAGKLKARDPQTMKLIPAKEIFTWNQPRDSAMVWDEKSEVSSIKVIQPLVNAEALSRIRIYQDWYLDISSGKLRSVQRSVELMQEVRSYDGIFRGYTVFCRLE